MSETIMTMLKFNYLTALVCTFFLANCASQSSRNQQDATYRPVIAEATSPVQRISPVAADGHTGMSFLRKPPGDGPFPAVMLIHGGLSGWEEDRIRDYALHIHASRFLAAGYVVVAVTRRDLDLDLPDEGEPEPVMDLIAIYDYLAGQPYVDADSIVARGTSVGGYLTLALAVARPQMPAIVVEEPFSFPFIGVSIGSEDQSPDVSNINRLQSDILLIRGDQTANINDFNREVFIPLLQDEVRYLQIETYPGQLHSFAFYDNDERTLHPAVSKAAFNTMEVFIRSRIPTKPTPVPESSIQHMQIPVPAAEGQVSRAE